MASFPLTYAALASSAVPDLYPTGVREHTASGDAGFTAAVVTTDGGEVIVRVPTNDTAAAKQAAENIGLKALTKGARAQLPFQVPEVLGLTRADDWPAVVYTFIPGEKFSVADLSPDAVLLASIAGTFESLHQLPSSLAAQAGLPVRTAEQCRVEAARLIDRAWATKRLPVAVKDRWEQVLRAVHIWDFQPATIHGSVSDDVLLVESDSIVGMLGFADFSFGDPALDFAWLCAAAPGVLDEVLNRYAERTSQDLNSLTARATFYHELDLAKWLLFGVENHNQEIIFDAENLLDALVDRAQIPLLKERAAPLNEAAVTELLAQTPEVQQAAAQTAEDLLDDERVFNADTDFIDPLPEQQ